MGMFGGFVSFRDTPHYVTAMQRSDAAPGAASPESAASSAPTVVPLAAAYGGPGPRWVAGADGCKAGWMVVLWRPATGEVRRRVVPSTEAVLALPEAPARLGLDMVIGLPEASVPGGRACDQAARNLLGWPRSSSIFSPPVQAALEAETFEEAQALQRSTGDDDAPGLTVQAFHLLDKIRALDARMTPARQARVREVHPELAFYAMNDDAPVTASKHDAEGRAERRALLEAHGFPDIAEAVAQHKGGGVSPADILDAHAACWTAGRLLRHAAERLPAPPGPAPRNARRLRMEMWR
jgi:predicted RNase H-like nuclease